MSRLLPLLLLLVLAGCKLIDQNTFAPAPEAKPPGPPAAPASGPRVDTRVPLVVIDYTSPNPEYRSLLGLAVHSAEQRDRAVQFDVISVANTVDAASAAQQHAVDVMRAILADGIPASRVHLGLRADPSLTTTQVRVYVR